jgi:hypothetical protein
MDVAEFGTGPEGGLRFWLLRDPGAQEGYRMEAVHPEFDRMSEDACGFTPSTDRPSDYPDHMPFLENSAVIVNTGTSGVTLLWMSPPHALNGLRHLVQESLDSGWEQIDPAPVPLATRESRRIDFRKEGASRALMLRISGSSGELTMIEASD